MKLKNYNLLAATLLGLLILVPSRCVQADADPYSSWLAGEIRAQDDEGFEDDDQFEDDDRFEDDEEFDDDERPDEDDDEEEFEDDEDRPKKKKKNKKNKKKKKRCRKQKRRCVRLCDENAETEAEFRQCRQDCKQSMRQCKQGLNSPGDSDDNDSGDNNSGGGGDFTGPTNPGTDLIVHEPQLTNSPYPAGLFVGRFILYFKDDLTRPVMYVYYSSGVTVAKALHAMGVGAQYLDPDEDGYGNDPATVEMMRRNNASLVMHTDRNLDNTLNPPDGVGTQPLYEDETELVNGQNGRFDYAIEEVYHLLTDYGFGPAHPTVWGVGLSSQAGQLVQKLRNQGHYRPEANEPNLDNETIYTEGLYWAFTSKIGAQNFSGRPAEIQAEWKLPTPAGFAAAAPELNALFDNPAYGFIKVVPDGVYNPPSE